MYFQGVSKENSNMKLVKLMRTSQKTHIKKQKLQMAQNVFQWSKKQTNFSDAKSDIQ